MQLADFNHIANYFSPVDSFQHILRILTAFVTTSRLLSFHRRQGGNIQQTGWMNAIQETIEDTIDSLPDDGHSAEMVHDTEARKRFIAAVPDLLNAGLGIGDDPPPPLLTERASPILVTLREECAMPDCGGTLRRKKDRETAVTLITRSYTQVKARLVAAYCSGCRAVYLPDRALVKDETTGELRQFYEYNACFLRISKPEMLWVERTVAVAQAQAILQHQTFSGYAAYFNRTYGPYGAASATDGLDEYLHPTITNDQSFRMFVEHMIRLIASASHLQTIFNTINDPPIDVLVKEANRILTATGILPDAREHNCSLCMHPKRYHSRDGQENRAGGSRFGVAGVDLTAPHLPTVQLDAQDVGTVASSDNEDDTTDDEEVLPNEEPQLEGPDRVVQMAVMDGIVTGHLICNAPVDPPCQNPPADFKTARFCKNHSTYNFQCGIKGCFRPIVPKLKVCNSAAHLEYYEQYQKRFARTSVYAVRRTMERRAEAQQQVAQRIDVDLSSIPAPLAPPSLPNNSSDQPTHHTFQAARTYCVQILTWSCGHPVAATKLYVSESESQVYNWITKVFPDTEEGRLFRPDYLAYDRACSLLRHIVTSHRGSSWIQSTRFIVDAWHYICHRVDDIVCRKRCNPAPSDGSQPDLIIEEPDETGRTVKRRAFNTETAEQLNAWFGGYKATLNRMTDYNFDFMVFSVLFLHAADWRYRRDEQDRMRERQEARRARADAEPAEENEGDGEESGLEENGELQLTENNMDIDMS